MKKIIIASLIIFLTNSLNALHISDSLITVTSTEEMFVIPDEVELEITIEEDGGQRIDKVEKAFWETLGVQSIDKNHLVLNNVNVMYYWYYWWSSRKASKKSKKIALKLNQKTNFLKLVKSLNKDWVINIKIIGVSNKKLEQYKKDIQIKAIKSAKEKASYLLQSIDEEIGRVVSVSELSNNQNQANNMQVVSTGYLKSSHRNFESIPEIRLKYSVKTTFRIK